MQLSFSPTSRVRLCPEEILAGAAARAAIDEGRALPLAGGPLAFAAVEALARNPKGGGVISHHFTIADLRDWAAQRRRDSDIAAELDRIAAPRPAWAGFALNRPLVMGILNVTPDSFSDAGAYFDTARAIEHGKALIAAGADIVDIGGEFTRPGADETPPEEELRRVLPVVQALAGAGVALSVDTRRAMVMWEVLAAGARIINDVTALTGDAGSLHLAAHCDAPLVLMHKAGEPRTMQEAPHYDDVALDVLEYLEARIAACEAIGIARHRICVDSGIGFGKHPIEHNLPLLRRLALLHATGCGIVLGLSRKSFIGRVSQNEKPPDRVAGSIAGALWGACCGVQILRVHDVAETRQALAVRQAILASLP